MVETSEGFLVAQLAEIVKPDAAADKAGYDQTRAAITKSMSNDMARFSSTRYANAPTRGPISKHSIVSFNRNKRDR